MRIVTADDLARLLTYEGLIGALADAFRSKISVPVRHHHTTPQPGTDATLLLMPACTDEAAGTQGGERFIGCKIVTVFPGNAKAGRPSLYGQYLLASGDTGEPLAMTDGPVLTRGAPLAPPRWRRCKPICSGVAAEPKRAAKAPPKSHCSNR